MQIFALDEEKRVKELSEGMKVKYLIALALSHHAAQLFILTSRRGGLDPVAREEGSACAVSPARAGWTAQPFEFDAHHVRS